MQSPTKVRSLWNWFIIGALIILGLWAGSGYVIYRFLPDSQGHGTFGDMFGAINALFSGLAFLGVIIAIILQKRELELQRAEIRYARKAQEDSARALKSQMEAAHLHVRIDGLNHVIDGLNSQIQRIEGFRTQAEKDSHDQIVADRNRYEQLLKNLIDELMPK